MLLYRLFIISIFITSGLVYQSAMLLLHFYYYQEKMFGSDVSPFHQGKWPVVALVDTEIHYGASYFLFWTSTGSTYLAAYMFYSVSVYTSNYYTECNLEELKPLDYKEQPSYPRLTAYGGGELRSIYPNLSQPETSANTAEIRSVANQSR
ncbi:hypothetical protein P879_01196 [Paragonimus westermani]|uniref:Uncharacterized protein n=1 Tax=Paragonimus westermani TaxID=34504 RepID=A0A8T0DVU9_9TREM|nr:hypothetical protein P879_01196 [Paragonimus westermani]